MMAIHWMLALVDEPAFCGCLVEARLLAVIEATQKEERKKAERNERLIAVAARSDAHAGVRSLKDLDSRLLQRIEHFFVNYNRERGRTFKPLARRGVKEAAALVAQPDG
jgi:inorganic pyrophosphatase